MLVLRPVSGIGITPPPLPANFVWRQHSGIAATQIGDDLGFLLSNTTERPQKSMQTSFLRKQWNHAEISEYA